MGIKGIKQIGLVVVAVLFSAGMAHAGSITVCGAGSTSDGNVAGCATIVTGTNSITVTLSNTTGSIQSIGQSLTDITFTVSSAITGSVSFNGSATGGSLLNCTSGTSCVAGDTSPPSGLAASNNWGWGASNAGSVVTLAAGGGSLKPGGIVNNSIDATKDGISNGPHNPWVLGPVTFKLTATGVSSSSTISSVSLSFGTGPSTIPAVVPEPGTLVLFGSGLLGVAAIVRRRLSS